jgi:hypothetical protein
MSLQRKTTVAWCPMSFKVTATALQPSVLPRNAYANLWDSQKADSRVTNIAEAVVLSMRLVFEMYLT